MFIVNLHATSHIQDRCTIWWTLLRTVQSEFKNSCPLFAKTESLSQIPTQSQLLKRGFLARSRNLKSGIIHSNGFAHSSRIPKFADFEAGAVYQFAIS